MFNMTQKLAVAVVHGIGKQDENFAEPLKNRLLRQFGKEMKGIIDEPGSELVIEPVFWQPCIQEREDALWGSLKAGGRLDWRKLRRFMIDFAGDAIAYQPAMGYRRTYDAIHGVMAESIHRLAEKAGAKAPLCVLAHSLGTIVASNYFYDLQTERQCGREIIPAELKIKIGSTPIEKGQTLTLLFTMGSPIALWGLRHDNFGSPVEVPSSALSAHWPGLEGRWINIYDRDDIIGYPLKSINDAYNRAVAEDRPVNTGNVLKCWNPACHISYFTEWKVIRMVAAMLAGAWRAVNR
jgi:hypothetical protein